MTAGEMRDLLTEDIGGLVSTFADITRTGCVDVRLERISHDACWKFHRDTVETRLVTTYRGPTTQWVPMAHSQRALDEQTAYAGPLERLGDHDVAVFKGNLAGQGGGVVHRSPPIEGTGVTRLFLCLNTPSIVSPGLWVGPRAPCFVFCSVLNAKPHRWLVFCRAVQRNPFSRLSRQSKVPKRTSDLSLSV